MVSMRMSARVCVRTREREIRFGIFRKRFYTIDSVRCRCIKDFSFSIGTFSLSFSLSLFSLALSELNCPAASRYFIFSDRHCATASFITSRNVTLTLAYESLNAHTRTRLFESNIKRVFLYHERIAKRSPMNVSFSSINS